jgi:hypothetical protein
VFILKIVRKHGTKERESEISDLRNSRARKREHRADTEATEPGVCDGAALDLTPYFTI